MENWSRKRWGAVVYSAIAFGSVFYAVLLIWVSMLLFPISVLLTVLWIGLMVAVGFGITFELLGQDSDVTDDSVVLVVRDKWVKREE